MRIQRQHSRLPLRGGHGCGRRRHHQGACFSCKIRENCAESPHIFSFHLSRSVSKKTSNQVSCASADVSFLLTIVQPNTSAIRTNKANVIAHNFHIHHGRILRSHQKSSCYSNRLPNQQRTRQKAVSNNGNSDIDSRPIHPGYPQRTSRDLRAEPIVHDNVGSVLEISTNRSFYRLK